MGEVQRKGVSYNDVVANPEKHLGAAEMKVFVNIKTRLVRELGKKDTRINALAIKTLMLLVVPTKQGYLIKWNKDTQSSVDMLIRAVVRESDLNKDAIVKKPQSKSSAATTYATTHPQSQTSAQNIQQPNQPPSSGASLKPAVTTRTESTTPNTKKSTTDKPEVVASGQQTLQQTQTTLSDIDAQKKNKTRKSTTDELPPTTSSTPSASKTKGHGHKIPKKPKETSTSHLRQATKNDQGIIYESYFHDVYAAKKKKQETEQTEERGSPDPILDTGYEYKKYWTPLDHEMKKVLESDRNKKSNLRISHLKTPVGKLGSYTDKVVDKMAENLKWEDPETKNTVSLLFKPKLDDDDINKIITECSRLQKNT